MQMRKVPKPYIFVIGFNKTGTTAIHRLFLDSGYKSIHNQNGRIAFRMMRNIQRGVPVLTGYDRRYQVFSDLQFRTATFNFEANSLFRQMNLDYPNSLFIYNYRDIDAWVQSRIRHDREVEGMTMLQLSKKIHNTDSVTRVVEMWVRERKQFETEIREYFAGTDQLLEIDIDSSDFVERIEAFTKLKLDSTKWQRHNVTETTN